MYFLERFILLSSISFSSTLGFLNLSNKFLKAVVLALTIWTCQSWNIVLFSLHVSCLITCSSMEKICSFRNKLMSLLLSGFIYWYLVPTQASENSGTVNLRHFAFYAFDGRKGGLRWSRKNEVPFYGKYFNFYNYCLCFFFQFGISSLYMEVLTFQKMYMQVYNCCHLICKCGSFIIYLFLFCMLI